MRVDRAAAERSWTGPEKAVLVLDGVEMKMWLRGCREHDVVHGYPVWGDAQADLLEHVGPRG